MTAKVPTIESGSARLGMTVAERFRRKRKITMTTSASVSSSVNRTSSTDSRIDDRAVEPDAQRRGGRQLLLEGGQELADPVDDLDGVGAGLLLDGERDRAARSPWR